MNRPSIEREGNERQAGASPAPAVPPTHAPSLVLLGFRTRLAGALLIIACLWLAVAWSLSG